MDARFCSSVRVFSYFRFFNDLACCSLGVAQRLPIRRKSIRRHNHSGVNRSGKRPQTEKKTNQTKESIDVSNGVPQVCGVSFGVIRGSGMSQKASDFHARLRRRNVRGGSANAWLYGVPISSGVAASKPMLDFSLPDLRGQERCCRHNCRRRGASPRGSDIDLLRKQLGPSRSKFDSSQK